MFKIRLEPINSWMCVHVKTSRLLSDKHKTWFRAHLVMLTMRHLQAWVNPPVVWEVTINNALVWMWGTLLKGICLSQMPVTAFIPATCRASMCGGVYVGRLRECSIYTLPIMCYLFPTSICSSAPCLQGNQHGTFKLLLQLLYFLNHLVC